MSNSDHKAEPNDDSVRTSHPISDSSSEPNRDRFLWYWRWFWRVTLVVSLYAAWYCYYVPSNSVAWAETYQSAQQESDETGKPMILYFTGKWCVPCRIMKRKVWADDEVAKQVNSEFVAVAIDVNDPVAAEVIGQFGVGATPNTVVVDPKGNVLKQRSGGLAKAEFVEWLDL